MGLFSGGNLLTLGIVVLVLALYRLLGRQERNYAANVSRKFVDALKTELAKFAGEKEEALRGLSAELNVQLKSASLMIKAIRDSAQKSDEQTAKIAKVEEATRMYDGVLAELGEMTARVQENLTRVKAESVFVEKAVKKISGTKSAIDTLEKNIAEITERFGKSYAESREDVNLFVEQSKNHVRDELENIRREISGLKDEARDKLGGSLAAFEETFSGELSRRNTDAQRRFEQWSEAMNQRVAELAEKTEADCGKIEQELGETARNRILEIDGHLIADLDHLKTKTGAFEDAVRGQMTQAEESMTELNEQLKRSLEETKADAVATLKTEIGRYTLETQDKLRASQRETAERLKSWQDGFSGELQAATAALEEAKRRGAEVFAETGRKAQALEAAIDETAAKVEAFAEQTKLFDKAASLKGELERSIEDLRADLDRLEQRRAEAADIETQFTKIKRLEDDINAKMVKFLSEQHRVEVMEGDFKRLLQTSQSVEQKLREVNASDDTLQEMQIELRKITALIAETEEKYQQLEKKGPALEATNEGIDRNFRALQETEKAQTKFSEDMGNIGGELAAIRDDVERLTAENEKVKEAVEKLAVLDDALEEIDRKIAQMNTARVWLADLEARMNEKTRELKDWAKIAGNTMAKREGAQGAAADKGAPSLGNRENVIRLKRENWSVEEIARTLDMPRSAVELILEMSNKP